MKLIILDRDGVINQDSEDYIKSADEWHAIPGSPEAIARLTHNGYRIVVASNQAGLARGKLTIETLNTIHHKMHDQISRYGGVIEAVFFCPHGPDDSCGCRKPKPGLYNEIARRLHVSLQGVISIGDKLSDVEAARAAGASPVLVKTGNGQSIVDNNEQPDDVPIYDDLAAAVDELISLD